MIYGYLQTANEADLRSQQTAIESYAQNRNLQIGGWLAGERELSESGLKAGDLLLLENWTRLGADVVPVIAAMKELLTKGVILCSWTWKNKCAIIVSVNYYYMKGEKYEN